MTTQMSFALLVAAFLVGCSTKYVMPPRNTGGYDYRLEVAGTNGNKQAGLKIACWRRPIMIGDSTVEYRRGLSTAGWLGTVATGVVLIGSGALGWSRGWAALGQYSIGLGVLLPVAAALLAPKHGEEKAPKSLLTFKPAVGEGIIVQNLLRSASRSYTTGANGAASVALRDIQDWFSGKVETGIWIAPLAAEDRRIAAKVTTTGSVAQVSVEELSIVMAETENTAEAYKDFLNEFPASKYAPQAGDSMELQYWRRACLADTREAYEEFKKECPRSESVAAVPGHIERLDWRRACQTNTRESYQEFKEMHPQSESVAMIPEHIERVDWDSASSTNTAESYAVYLRSYPSGLFVAEARQGIERLEQVRRDSVQQAAQAQRLAEDQRRAEAEKYRLRTNEEANQEWTQFRSNEEALKGTVTTWELKVWHIFGGNLCGYLDDQLKHSVTVAGGEYESESYLDEAFLRALDSKQEQLPVVKENDWIVVTGKFSYVSADGSVVLSTVRVKNEGYRE